MSRYIVEIEIEGRWVYETQAQILRTAKKIVDRLNESVRPNGYRVYDNITGDIVHPKIKNAT